MTVPTMDLVLEVAGTALLLIGLVISFRNRSPYTRTHLDLQPDEHTVSRLRLSQYVIAAGFACHIIQFVLRHWAE